MAVRNDLTVDWSVSPRVITVAAPSTEINIKDLHDSCRTLESAPNAMDNKVLIDTAGLEDLGGGTSVGLTATLQNALIAFEARLGPAYEQCRVNGGNVVAIDGVGATLATPIFPTAFTQVVTTASSSATSQNQASLEYSSFSNGVWLNPSNGGIFNDEQLAGNAQFPVDNVPLVRSIMATRGLPETIYLLGNAIFDTGDDVTNCRIIGQNAIRSTITINTNSITNGCTIEGAHIIGNLDGGTMLERCVIDNLDYINGFVYNCMIDTGTISLGGVNAAHFLNCYSGVPGTGTPIIDMDGAGSEDTPLAIRGYNGGIKLIHKTGVASCSIDLSSGQVIIDSTCVAGTIVVRGDGKVVDENGNHMMSGTYNGGLTLINEANFGDHVHDIWTMLGLNPDRPIVIGNGKHSAVNLDVDVTDNGNGTYTLSRN